MVVTILVKTYEDGTSNNLGVYESRCEVLEQIDHLNRVDAINNYKAETKTVIKETQNV